MLEDKRILYLYIIVTVMCYKLHIIYVRWVLFSILVIRIMRLPQQIKCFSASNFSICFFVAAFSFLLIQHPSEFIFLTFALLFSNPSVCISLTNNFVYLPFSFKSQRLRSHGHQIEKKRKRRKRREDSVFLLRF